MGGTASGIRESQTARKEGKRLQDTANANNTLQLEMFEQQRKDTEPWRQAGLSALPNLQDQNNFKDFSMADFQKDPGYQFRMDEGTKALERSAAARGGLNSGATMKALNSYGQGMASEEYKNAYNRFTADRDSRYNRLASLAGIGQVANTQIGNAGQNFANAFGQNSMAGANARASANIAGMRAINEGHNSNKQMIMQGGGMMFCDARVKKNFASISDLDIAEFRDNIQPLIFQYISNEFGEGDFIGPIAQDLEKSKLGRTLVKTNAQGVKYIDETRALMLLLALQGKAA